MALQSISQEEFMRNLQKAGISNSVQAAQVLEAVRLYIQSELSPETGNYIEPLYVRQEVLVIRSSSSAYAGMLKEHEVDLIEYVFQTTNKRISRIQFTV